MDIVFVDIVKGELLSIEVANKVNRYWSKHSSIIMGGDGVKSK